MRRAILLVGWYGVAAILAAYLLATVGLITVRSWVYLVLNLTGAIGVLIEALWRGDYQPVVLNVFWAVIALVGVIRLVAG